MRTRTGWLISLSGLVLAAGMSPSAHAALSDSKYLRDHAETRAFTLGRPTHALPTPDGSAVLFLRARARTPKLELYEFDVPTRQTRLLLKPEDVLNGAEETLSPEEKALRERMRVSVGGFTDFKLSKDGRRILLSLSGKLYVLERTRGGAIRELKTTGGSPLDAKFSPDGQSVSYVLGHDVFVYNLADDKERPVTTGGTEAISHGLAEFVAREEMLRFSGYWWSPDSRSIAYQESDATEVEIWYVADPAKPGETPSPVRYPRPGKANVKVRLGIVAGGRWRDRLGRMGPRALPLSWVGPLGGTWPADLGGPNTRPKRTCLAGGGCPDRPNEHPLDRTRFRVG